LKNLDFIVDLKESNGGIRISISNKEKIPILINFLTEKGIKIFGIEEVKTPLEDIYLALTKEE